MNANVTFSETSSRVCVRISYPKFAEDTPEVLNLPPGFGVTVKVFNTQTGDKLKLLPIPED